MPSHHRARKQHPMSFSFMSFPDITTTTSTTTGIHGSYDLLWTLSPPFNMTTRVCTSTVSNLSCTISSRCRMNHEIFLNIWSKLFKFVYHYEQPSLMLSRDIQGKSMVTLPLGHPPQKEDGQLLPHDPLSRSNTVCLDYASMSRTPVSSLHHDMSHCENNLHVSRMPRWEQGGHKDAGVVNCNTWSRSVSRAVGARGAWDGSIPACQPRHHHDATTMYQSGIMPTSRKYGKVTRQEKTPPTPPPPIQ